MKSDEAIALLEKAFADVRLEDGLSLRQAELVDDMSYRMDARWDQAKKLDVVDDWRRIPTRDLEDLCYLAHLDAAGFRYYIPALLTQLARSYDPSWLNVIQVFTALNPDKEGWDYHMHRYSLLSRDQKEAIAKFLAALESFVNLDAQDAATIQGSLQRYWMQFLPNEKPA